MLVGQREYWVIYWTNQGACKKNHLLWKFYYYTGVNIVPLSIGNIGEKSAKSEFDSQNCQVILVSNLGLSNSFQWLLLTATMVKKWNISSLRNACWTGLDTSSVHRVSHRLCKNWSITSFNTINLNYKTTISNNKIKAWDVAFQLIPA